MYVTEKYQQGLFTTICSTHQPTWDWRSLLWLLYVLPTIQDLQYHIDDPCLNQLKAATVKRALDERFAKYLKTDNSEFDPLPAVACLLSPDIAKVAYCSTDNMVSLLIPTKKHSSKFRIQSAVQQATQVKLLIQLHLFQKYMILFIWRNSNIYLREFPNKHNRHWTSSAMEISRYIAEVWLMIGLRSLSVRL